jgi:hypothetical protein
VLNLGSQKKERALSRVVKGEGKRTKRMMEKLHGVELYDLYP